MATSHPNNTSELEPHVSREGQAKVDFLLELSPFLPVTRKILSYLSPQDLCRSSCVTRDWNKLIENDKDAHFRKVKHIQAQLELLYAVGKENWPDLMRAPIKKKKRPKDDNPKKGLKRKGLSIIKGVNFTPSRI